MTDFASLGISIDSRNVVKAEKDLDKFGRTAGRAEKSTSQLKKATSLATTAFAGISAALVTRQIGQYADSFTAVTSQLRQLTSSEKELISTRKQISDVAKESRSEFEATASLYARLTRATSEMGVSHERILGIVGSVNKAFKIEGASAQETAGAIRQLSQGLAAGALRGDEFNSVAEGAPAIMDAIATSLRMTRGELREFAATGGITADIVIDAMEKASDAIDERFAKTVRRLGEAAEVANTNLINFFGTSSTVSGVVGVLGASIITLSENVSGLLTVGSAIAVIYGSKVVASFIASRLAASAQTAANIKLLASEQALAASALHRATQDQAAAARSLAVVQSINARSAAVTRLATANQALISSQARATASTTAYTAATSLSAKSTTALGNAVNFLGGALGVNGLLVFGLSRVIKSLDTLYQMNDKVRDSISELAKSELSELIKRQKDHVDVIQNTIDRMSGMATQNIQTARSIKIQSDRLNEANHLLVDMQRQMLKLNKGASALQEFDDMVGSISKNIDLFKRSLDPLSAANEKLSSTFKNLSESVDGMSKSTDVAISKAADYVSQLELQLAQMSMTNDQLIISEALTRAGSEATGEEIVRTIELTRAISSRNAENKKLEDSMYGLVGIYGELSKAAKTAGSDISVGGLTDVYDDLSISVKKAANDTKLLDDAQDNMIENIQSKLSSMIKDFDFTFKGVFGSIIDGWKTVVAEITSKNITEMIFGGKDFSVSGIFSGIGSVIPGLDKIAEGFDEKGLVGGISSGIGVISGGLKSIGSELLGVAKAIPGWGWAAAGAAALSAVFNKKETPSFNSGFLLEQPAGAKESQTFAVEAFKSGLQPVGFNRRSSEQESRGVIDLFREIDSAFVGLIDKINVTANTDRSTFSALDERGMGSGLFIGAAGEEGSPGQSLESQQTTFIRDLINSVDDQLKNIFSEQEISSIKSGTSASEILKSLSDAVSLHTGDVKEGVDSATSDMSKSILAVIESVKSRSDTQLQAMSELMKIADDNNISNVQIADALGVSETQIESLISDYNKVIDREIEVSKIRLSSVRKLEGSLSGIKELSKSITESILEAQGVSVLRKSDGSYSDELRFLSERRDMIVSNHEEQMNLERRLHEERISIGSSLSSFANDLKLGDASPLKSSEKLSLVQDRFRQTLESAISGDIQAARNLQDAAQDYADISRENFASSSTNKQQMAEIIGGLDKASSILAESEFDPSKANDRLVSQLEQINDTLLGMSMDIGDRISGNLSLIFASLSSMGQSAANDSSVSLGLGEYNSNISNENIKDTISSIGASSKTEEEAVNKTYNLAVENNVGSGQIANALGTSQESILELADRYGLPAFANGGVTSGPSIAGEAGPEAVVPLPNGREIPIQDTGRRVQLNATERNTEELKLIKEELSEIRNFFMFYSDMRVQQSEQAERVARDDRINNAPSEVSRVNI